MFQDSATTYSGLALLSSYILPTYSPRMPTAIIKAALLKQMTTINEVQPATVRCSKYAIKARSASTIAMRVMVPAPAKLSRNGSAEKESAAVQASRNIFLNGYL